MISNVPCTAQKLHQQVQYELNVHQIYKAATCRRHAAAEAAAQVSPSAKTVRPISRQPSYLQPATGYVPREADVAHVPGDFQQLLDSVVTAYQAACGPRLAGVYLRGSLPRGLFLPGISDVDTFAVVLPTTTADGSSSSNGDTNGSSSSTDSSLQDLQQAVQRLSTPAVQAHQHLGYTKVEVRVLQVASQAAAAALAARMQQDSSNTKQNAAGQHSSRKKVAELSPSVSAAVPYAFELKTASICLAGLDLPQLLHPSAALPPQFEVLLGLAGSVEDAQAAVQAAAAAVAAAAAPGAPAGSEAVAVAAAAAAPHMEVQVRATKWALKRLLRGAFELVQDRAGCHTRDLFWCCHEAKQHVPQLQQQLSQRPSAQQHQHGLQQDWQVQLDAALLLYVGLQTTLLQFQQQAGLLQAVSVDQQQQQQQEGTLAGRVSPDEAAAAATAAAVLEAQQQLQQLVDDSWNLVQALLPKLETLFLKAMLFEEPGWLTQHTAHPIPACPNSSSSSSNESEGLSRGQQPQQQQPSQQQQGKPDQQHSTGLFASKALQALQVMLGPAATAATTAAGGGKQRGRGSISQVMGAVPPDVQVPILGQIEAFDWQQQEGRAAAAAAVCRILSPGSDAPSSSNGDLRAAGLHSSPPPAAAATNGGSSSSRSNPMQGLAVSELLGCLSQPVVLRGAAASWPCVEDGWDLAWLAQQGIQGKVRVAPSLQFPFVEPQLLEILLRLKGARAAPSILADMSAAEFVQRLQPSCRMPPLAYTASESYYWQADLPPHLNQQQQLAGLLQAFSGCDPGQGQQQDQPQQECVRVTQQTRLWVSPAGAVSPLHYDKSTSFLVQVTGVKRMLFFSPDQLHRLYCYPDTHVLRRRSRVNVSAPDLRKHPLFEGAAALEAVLQPGDVVCFPSFWAHYTESLGQGQRPPVAAPDGLLVDPVGCSMSVTFRCQALQGA